MAEDRTFEIGLVLAGTVSAGAYTAGAIDFLLEALEAWQTTKDREKDVPPEDRSVPDHAIKLRAVSGASGGAITAALLARCLVSTITPLDDASNSPDPRVDDPTQQPRPFNNPLYATWVQSVDIRHFLKSKDLEAQSAKVVSLLDSTVLPYIGDNALNVSRKRSGLPPYVGDPLDLFFTITNLRGVPYGFGFAGQIAGYKHMMTAFADNVRFALCTTKGKSQAADEAVVLDPNDVSPAGSWETMLKAALASSAFPLGLAPRLLSRRATDYANRQWPIPQARPLRRSDRAASEDGAVSEDELSQQRKVVCEDGTRLVAVCEQMRNIPPKWPADISSASYTYEFWNVDGGLMNNQPLELVRQVLAGNQGHNPRGGNEAACAVIMVEPFPTSTDVTPAYDKDISLVSVMIRMFSALKEQARFKAEDLALAQDPNVYSRFVVAPIYIDSQGLTTEPPIASDLLGGFGGFLAERFRHHDFVLGRRNCQQFLRNHFMLPEDNPLFANAPERWFTDFATPDRDPRGKRFLPIIPLVGKVADEVPLPRRPRRTDVDLTALRRAVTARLEAVVPRLIGEVPIWLGRVGLTAIWRGVWLLGQRHRVADMIMAKIERELGRLP